MIKIEVENQKVLTALNPLALAGANLTPAMQDIGEYLTKATKNRFGAATKS